MTETRCSRRSFVGLAALGAAAAGMGLAGCSSQTEAQKTEGTATTASTNGASTARPVVLVVSFGTSYDDSRHITIGAIEDAIREKYWPEWEVRRAFTAQTILDILNEREGIAIDNVADALDRCVADGVTKLVVQPTHLMNGYEYTDLKDELADYESRFDAVSLGDPLLSSDADFTAVAQAIAEAMASYDDGETAICLMGHGTEADSNSVYGRMQEVFRNEGLNRFFVGTVEAAPTCADVIAGVQAAGCAKAVLAPFMVVAGDHANNDMADAEDPDSWVSQFTAAGIETTCVLSGLGQHVGIQDVYVGHVENAMAAL